MTTTNLSDWPHAPVDDETIAEKRVDPMKPHLMIDLETMDTEPSGAIVSIGACKFDMRTGDIVDTFYAAISLEDAVKEGRTMSPGTVLWWMTQGDAAREALVTDTVGMRHALTQFQLFAKGQEDGIVWANDPDFDCVMLRSAMQSVGLMYPFKFWNHRSVRTAKHLSHPNGDFPAFSFGEDGVAHNALDDAIKQAAEVIFAVKLIEQGLPSETF